VKLKEYFTDPELACRCGCGLLPPESSVERLYALRMLYHKAMNITSGARCLKHNKAVGGATGSTHLPEKDRSGDAKSWGGQGFDIRISSRQEAAEIEALALQCGFRGFGYANTFIHIDDANRPQITRWIY
jgi:uncharacterized protein YcbK (DUF882 family)